MALIINIFPIVFEFGSISFNLNFGEIKIGKPTRISGINISSTISALFSQDKHKYDKKEEYEINDKREIIFTKQSAKYYQDKIRAMSGQICFVHDLNTSNIIALPMLYLLCYLSEVWYWMNRLQNIQPAVDYKHAFMCDKTSWKWHPEIVKVLSFHQENPQGSITPHRY